MTTPHPVARSGKAAPENPVRILEGQAASDRAGRAVARYVAELDERFAGGFDPALVETVAPRDVTPPRGDFLLLTELGTGEVLGFGGVRVLEGGEVELWRMWLDPSARGRGLGRFLLRALENRARALGGDRVVLNVNSALTEATALYSSAGYTPAEPFAPNPYADVVLGKDL